MRLPVFLAVLLAAVTLTACVSPPPAPPPDEDVGVSVQPATSAGVDVWDVLPVPIGISTLGTFRDANQKRCVTEGGWASYNETVPTVLDLTGVQCAPGNVTSAVLRVTYDNWQGASAFALHKILRPWNPAQVTWANAATGQPWAAVGGTDSTDIAGAPVLMPLSANGNVTGTVDITALVQGWLAAPTTARGLLFRTTNIAAAGAPYKSVPAHFWPDNISGDPCTWCSKPAGWTVNDWKPRLRITCPGGLGAICGSGSTDAGESCDDGNTANGDGCSSTCEIETGFVCGGAPSVCAPVCGDGVKASTEGCDDAGTVAGDGCSAGCAVEFGYACAGVPSACATVCGDGKVAGDEGCDDGGVAGGDGCSAGCAVETGWSCSGTAPSSCAAVCGDGLVRGGETCDDGGTAAGDGCGAACQIDVGFVCAGEPSACGTVCGDGVLAGEEPCDDGNLVSGDGCSADCEAEVCSCQVP